MTTPSAPPSNLTPDLPRAPQSDGGLLSSTTSGRNGPALQNQNIKCNSHTTPGADCPRLCTEELEINDFVQSVRQRMTDAATLNAISASTGCTISVQGILRPPKCKPIYRCPKLHLHLEGTAQSVERGMAELRRILADIIALTPGPPYRYSATNDD